MAISLTIRNLTLLAFSLSIWFSSVRFAEADGKVIPPRNHKGLLEERAQEAIIIFHGSDQRGGGKEDLILKIEVEGDVENFAWVVPFPSEPTIAKEDPKLFKELFDYVEARSYQVARSNSGALGGKSVSFRKRADVGHHSTWPANRKTPTKNQPEDRLSFEGSR